jgi:hypothetical protein
LLLQFAEDEDDSMFVNWWDNPTNPDVWHKHQASPIELHKLGAGGVGSAPRECSSEPATCLEFKWCIVHAVCVGCVATHPCQQPAHQQVCIQTVASHMVPATPPCCCPPQLAWWGVAFWGAIFYTAFGGKKKEKVPAAEEVAKA